MGFATALFVFLFVAATDAMEYVVGGSSGWATGIDYGSWVSSNTFSVGDTLVFQYGALHTVKEVSESDYSACSASNAIQTFGNQNTKITLTAPGTRYFICGTTAHCTQGMKLAVPVSAASSATTTPTGSFTPAIPEGSITPPSETTPYQPYTPPSETTPYQTYTPPSATNPYQPYGYGRPYYDYNSSTGIRSGFCGLLFAVFIVITLLNN